MGTYTSLAQAGARARATHRRGSGRGGEHTDRDAPPPPPFVCPRCGDGSCARTRCDACGLDMIACDRSVPLVIDPPTRTSLATERRAGLLAAVLTVLVIGAPLALFLERQPAESMPGIVSWPVVGAMALTAAAGALAAAITAWWTRQHPRPRAPKLAGVAHVEGGVVSLETADGERVRVSLESLRASEGARARVRIVDGEHVELCPRSDDRLEVRAARRSARGVRGTLGG